MTTTEDRERKAEEHRLARIARIAMVSQLKKDGMSNAKIAHALGIDENDVRTIVGK